MFNKVSCDILELDGIVIFLIDSIKQVYEHSHELFVVHELGVFQELLHELDELLNVDLLARHEFELLR